MLFQSISHSGKNICIVLKKLTFATVYLYIIMGLGHISDAVVGGVKGSARIELFSVQDGCELFGDLKPHRKKARSRGWRNSPNTSQ